MMNDQFDIDAFVTSTGESSNIDAKGPVSWDGGVESASLAKDIAAFANSKDGGVLVIGKSEDKSGNFVMTGLTAEQAASFETTKVARWINNHFAPPINLVCHQHLRDGKRFVVITVEEFQDIPAICTKQYQDPHNPKKLLLREKTLYVRNANAESAPIETVEELRSLIGLATAKRATEMLSTFEGMLKGRPLLKQVSDEEQFQNELLEVEKGLGSDCSAQLKAGAWKFVIRPSKYFAERWDSDDKLDQVIRKHSVRIMREFPAYQRGTHIREWGICNNTYRETWTLARSGQFLCVRPYWENHKSFDSPYITMAGDPDEPSIPPGGWLDFKSNLLLIVEMFMFAARLAEEFDAVEDFVLHLQGTDLVERKLATTDSRIFLSDPYECRATLFEFKKVVPVVEFRADWEAICAMAMKRFVDLFPGPSVDLHVMQSWIEKFKSRNF